MVFGGEEALLGMVFGGEEALLGMVFGGDEALLGMVFGGEEALLGMVFGGDEALLGMVFGGEEALLGMVFGWVCTYVHVCHCVLVRCRPQTAPAVPLSPGRGPQSPPAHGAGVCGAGEGCTGPHTLQEVTGD